jgi:hypothetical protein
VVGRRDTVLCDWAWGMRAYRGCRTRACRVDVSLGGQPRVQTASCGRADADAGGPRCTVRPSHPHTRPPGCKIAPKTPPVHDVRALPPTPTLHRAGQRDGVVSRRPLCSVISCPTFEPREPRLSLGALTHPRGDVAAAAEPHAPLLDEALHGAEVGADDVTAHHAGRWRRTGKR